MLYVCDMTTEFEYI